MEKIIEIPEWKLKQIENAIRITLNAYKMRTKETCLFREMCKASEFANEALANADTRTNSLHKHSVNNLAKLAEFVKQQKDLPPDINDIVNGNFWELI